MSCSGIWEKLRHFKDIKVDKQGNLRIEHECGCVSADINGKISILKLCDLHRREGAVYIELRHSEISKYA